MAGQLVGEAEPGAVDKSVVAFFNRALPVEQFTDVRDMLAGEFDVLHYHRIVKSSALDKAGLAQLLDLRQKQKVRAGAKIGDVVFKGEQRGVCAPRAGWL